MQAEELASRYERLWPYLAAATPSCHRAVFYDNATDEGPTELASYRFDTADYAPRWPVWTPNPLLRL